MQFHAIQIESIDKASLFLLHVLFDLIVQSPLNKKKTLHHFRQNTSNKPERTTAFPPARNAVLIQAGNKSEENNKTHKQKPPEMVKSVASRNCTTIQIKRPHTATTRY